MESIFKSKEIRIWRISLIIVTLLLLFSVFSHEMWSISYVKLAILLLPCVIILMVVKNRISEIKQKLNIEKNGTIDLTWKISWYLGLVSGALLISLLHIVLSEIIELLK